MDMKIISVNIKDFGGLCDFDLEFSDGLNVIEGANESGKSTVLLFVMYMLFGISKSSRRGTPSEFDKDRSISRRSGRAAGSMEVECDGVRYRIERNSLKRGRSSEVTVTDLATGERMFPGREPGEALLGVSRETFESCLWCAQSRSFVISSEGVHATLSNLSLTADESVNGDKVKKAIQDEKKRYKHERGNGGLLNDAMSRVESARARIDAIDAAMIRTSHLTDEAERTEAQKAAAEARRAKADAARRASASLAILDRFDKLSRLRGELEGLTEERDALGARYPISAANPDREMLFTLKSLRSAIFKRKEDLKLAREAMPADAFVDMAAVDMAAEISASEGEAGFIGRIKGAISSAAARRRGALAFLAIGAAAIIAAVVAFILDGIIATVICAILGVALGALAIMNYSAASRAMADIERELAALGMSREDFEKRIRDAFAQLRVHSEAQRINGEAATRVSVAERQLADAEREAGAFFARFSLEYSDPAADELALQIKEYLDERDRIERAISNVSGILKHEETALAGYDEAAIRAGLPENIESFAGDAQAEYERADREYKLAEDTLSRLRVQIATEGAGADARADAVAQLEAAKAERDAYKDRHDILALAYEAVDRAYENMRRNFAPKIRERAGAYLSEISGGRYRSVILSEDMQISVDDGGESVAVGTLSAGTADAVYVALRMSLIENIFEGGVPLFMDESLSSLDDTRAEGVLRMIERFVGGGSQCLLFTCHSRERALCEKMNIEHNFIKL